MDDDDDLPFLGSDHGSPVVPRHEGYSHLRHSHHDTSGQAHGQELRSSFFLPDCLHTPTPLTDSAGWPHMSDTRSERSSFLTSSCDSLLSRVPCSTTPGSSLRSSRDQAHSVPSNQGSLVSSPSTLRAATSPTRPVSFRLSDSTENLFADAFQWKDSQISVGCPVEIMQQHSTGVDWNMLFQSLPPYSLLDANEEQCRQRSLFHLGHGFVSVAKTYGKIIISELSVPDQNKTIKPINVGGIAGGVKYLCHSILFKIPKDIRIDGSSTKFVPNFTLNDPEPEAPKHDYTSTSSASSYVSISGYASCAYASSIEPKPPVVQGQREVWLYGGDKADDAAALKAASHDLRGLIACYNTKTPDLHFPLMAIIDYRGFRIVAVSILPVTPSGPQGTIRYGSPDGGQTVHDSDPLLRKSIARMCRKIRLQPHLVGDRVTMHGPADMEGHLGKDGKYYLLDFARCFPPEAPSKCTKSIFSQLLRPELLQRYATPLSSDAFSKFQLEEQRDELDQAVKAATKYLHTEVIPLFARTLDNIDPDQLHSVRLCEELHRYGINVRHLGRIRAHCSHPAIRRLLLTEMVSRCQKNHLNHLLRVATIERKASIDPWRTTILNFLSILFTGTSKVTEHSSQWNTVLSDRQPTSDIDPKSYWTTTLKDQINRTFSGERVFKSVEKGRDYDLRLGIDPVLWINRLQQLSGIFFSARLHCETLLLRKLPQLPVPILESDIIGMKARVRHMNIIDEAEANSLLFEARNYRGAHPEQLWQLVSEKFEQLVKNTPYNHHALHQWGVSLYEYGRCKLSSDQCAVLFSSAVENFEKEITIEPDMAESHFRLGLARIESAVAQALYSKTATYGSRSYVDTINAARKSLTTATSLTPAKIDEIFAAAKERSALAAKSNQSELVRFMLLLSAMELHSARLLCLDRACSYHPPLRCSDEPMTDPAEFWKPPSTIEICEAQYDLAKSILEFVVEVKDDCSVLEHLFFQVAQLLESVIVSAPSFRFEDSNAVYRVSRISEQHDRNEQHFVDVLINEQNSEEYIRKHHTLDHELLLRHSLTLLEDELYQSVECLFVRSRRYCRLPARPFDIMLSHPFGATFALTSVSVHFFPANEQTYPRPLKVQFFVVTQQQLRPIAEVLCDESADKTTIRFPVPVVASQIQVSLEPNYALATEDFYAIQWIGFTGNQVYSSIADPTLDSKRPRIRSLFCDAERSTSHTANHGALRNSDHLAALLRTCRYSSIVSALIEAHVSFRSSPVLQMSCFNHRVTNYRNLTFTSLMLDDQALKLLGTHCSHLASLHLSAITSISDKVMRAFIDSHTELVSLRFEGCNALGKETIGAISRRTTLRELWGWSRMDDNSLLRLKRLDRIRRFRLVENRSLTPSTLITLVKAWRFLEHLDCSKCTAAVTDKVLAVVRKHCKALQSLTLGDCFSVTERGLNEISSVSQLRSLSLGSANKRLEHSDQSLARIVDSLCNLQTLVLPHCEYAGELTMSAIASRTKLEVLDLSYCQKLPQHSFMYIAGAGSSLRQLFLRGTKVHCEAVERFVARHPHLNLVALSGCANISDAALRSLQQATRLATLELIGTPNITEDGVAQVMLCCTSLTRLDLRHCPQITSACQAIARSIRADSQLLVEL